MPRKTRYEIQALTTPAEPGSEQYWKTKAVEARAKKSILEAQHRKLLIDKMTGDLIPRDEVRDMFTRVFSAYRQAIREIDRRYGPEAAGLLIAAERSALRVQQEEPTFCSPTTSRSGNISEPTSQPKEASANSRKRKS